MSKNIFITGTGTDIGKTFVTGLIVKKLHESGHSAAYYKAAMSGNKRREDGSLIPGDALYVKTVSGIGQPLAEMCPYIYENAFSPHLASRLEGNPVQMQVVKEGFEAVGRKYEYVTMEGSGGMPDRRRRGARHNQRCGPHGRVHARPEYSRERNYFQPFPPRRCDGRGQSEHV